MRAWRGKTVTSLWSRAKGVKGRSKFPSRRARDVDARKDEEDRATSFLKFISRRIAENGREHGDFYVYLPPSSFLSLHCSPSYSSLFSLFPRVVLVTAHCVLVYECVHVRVHVCARAHIYTYTHIYVY